MPCGDSPTWPDAPITAQRNLERMRNFFRFCEDSKWIDSNPAKAVKPPKVTAAPTMPFEPEDFETLLAKCDEFSMKGIYRAGNRTRLKAMLLLLRYSGLRIRDAATLERVRIKNGKLFLYTQKTGTPVWLPLPKIVTDALADAPNLNKNTSSGRAMATRKRRWPIGSARSGACSRQPR